MNFEEMTIAEIKTFLDENGVDYTGLRKKEELINLAQGVSVEANDEPETVENVGTGKVLQTVKSALKIEKTVTKKNKDDEYIDYLLTLPQSRLSNADRALIRSRVEEYESKESGVEIKLNPRLQDYYKSKDLRISGGKIARFFRNSTYIVSQEDFEALKKETIKVGGCCGNPVKEEFPAVEVVDD